MKKIIILITGLVYTATAYTQSGLFTFREVTYLTKKTTNRRFFIENTPVTALEKVQDTIYQSYYEIESTLTGANNPGNQLAYVATEGKRIKAINTVEKTTTATNTNRFKLNTGCEMVNASFSKDTLFINRPLYPSNQLFLNELEAKYPGTKQKITELIAKIEAGQSQEDKSAVAKYKSGEIGIEQITYILLKHDNTFENNFFLKSIEAERMVLLRKADDPNERAKYFILLRNRQKVALFSTNFEIGIPVIPIKYRARKFEKTVTTLDGKTVNNLTDRFEFAINGNLYLGARLGRTTYYYDKYAGMKSYNMSAYLGMFAGFGAFALKTNNIPEADSATLTRFNKDLNSVVFNTGFTYGFDFRGFQLGMYLGWDIPLNADYRKVWYYRNNNFFIGFGVGYAIGLLKGKS